MLIFAERHAKAVHDAALFSRLCESGVSPVGCLTSLSSFFPVTETRNWHQDVVITRGVHFSAFPDRRVDPSTVVGRGPCVLQIKLSWKQTGTTQPAPNKLTLPLTDAYDLPRYLVFQLELDLLQFTSLYASRVALNNTLFRFTLEEAWFKPIFIGMLKTKCCEI